MEFCFNCGSNTDPDWVFCRSCGSTLDAPEPARVQSADAVAAPKVELISRGWDVVDVEPGEGMLSSIDGNTVSVPLPPQAIEISVDDVTVVATPPKPVPTDEAPPTQPEAVPVASTDRWDHLRPHGQIPPATAPTATPARTGQISVLVVALATVTAAIVHLYLNVQLDGFGRGTITRSAIGDVMRVADASLLVMAGLGAIAMTALAWWFLRSWRADRFRLGFSGSAALINLMAGIGLVVFAYITVPQTVGEAIAANTFIIIGLALLMVSCLATVRMVERANHGDTR